MVIHLLQAGQTVYTLLALDLSNNNIGENGATAIAKALETNTTLSTLYLKNNNIGDNGINCLLACIEKNKAIKKITVCGGFDLVQHLVRNQ